MLVISDSSPIILLSRLGVLHLLPALYGRIIIPGDVREEVVDKGAGLPGSQEMASATWFEVIEPNQNDALGRSLRGELGPGEAAALALAVELNAELVLVDDRQGRLAAQRLGLSVKGTLGILTTAKRKGLIQAIRPLLDALVAEGAWLSPALRQNVLQAVGED